MVSCTDRSLSRYSADATKTTYLYEYYALSTDDKPTDNVANGSRLIEMDTASVYFFDEENSEWIKFEKGD